MGLSSGSGLGKHRGSEGQQGSEFTTRGGVVNDQAFGERQEGAEVTATVAVVCGLSCLGSLDVGSHPAARGASRNV